MAEHLLTEALLVRRRRHFADFEPDVLRRRQRAIGIDHAAAFIKFAVEGVELLRRKLGHGKFDAAAENRGNAEHRKRHQHQPHFLVACHQLIDVGGGLAAIGAIEIVELRNRHLALRIGGDDRARQLLDLAFQFGRNAMIGDDAAVVGLDRKFAIVGMGRQRRDDKQSGKDQARERNHVGGIAVGGRCLPHARAPHHIANHEYVRRSARRT
jgi:hypothetical protein